MTETVIPFAPGRKKRGRAAPPEDGGGQGDGYGGGPPEGQPPAGGEFDWEMAWHPRNDLGNARRLQARFGADLRYGANIGWLAWDGKRWSVELGETMAIRSAHEVAELIREEAKALRKGIRPIWFSLEQWDEFCEKHQKFAVTAGNQRQAVNMLAASEPYLMVHARDLDADHRLFNCRNGTLCLGELVPGEFGEPVVAIEFRPHERQDLITHIAPVDYDPEAECPVFDAFLRQILPDPSLQVFVQKMFGYALTGDVSEQVMFILYGTGANGKSTLTDAIAHVLGDYSVATSIQTFMFDPRRSGGQATPDIARLPGRRLVLANEPEQGMRFSESIVKLITGGDVMTARNLNEGFFEFKPVFKLYLSANLKPVIRGQDEGIWRRMRLIPFEQFIPAAKRDRRLPQKLLSEASGILNWLLDGYRMWKEQGLTPPDAVLRATEEYRAESDPVGEFMGIAVRRVPADECPGGLAGTGPSVYASRLYALYCKWAGANGMRPFSGTAFGRRLSDLGYHKDKLGGYVVYLDLEIVQEEFGGLEGSGGSSGPKGSGGADGEGGQ